MARPKEVVQEEEPAPAPEQEPAREHKHEHEHAHLGESLGVVRGLLHVGPHLADVAIDEQLLVVRHAASRGVQVDLPHLRHRHSTRQHAAIIDIATCRHCSQRACAAA
eukprot:521590-Rhodomonas_salina.2